MDAAVTNGETAVRPLTAEHLSSHRSNGPDVLNDGRLQPVDGLVGQARAVEAIRFGTQVGKTGFTRLPPDAESATSYLVARHGSGSRERWFASLSGSAGNHGVRTFWNGLTYIKPRALPMRRCRLMR